MRWWMVIYIGHQTGVRCLNIVWAHLCCRRPRVIFFDGPPPIMRPAGRQKREFATPSLIQHFFDTIFQFLGTNFFDTIFQHFGSLGAFWVFAPVFQPFLDQRELLAQSSNVQNSAIGGFKTNQPKISKKVWMLNRRLIHRLSNYKASARLVV